MWNELAGWGGRAGPSRVGRPGGALLGPEKSGASPGWGVDAGFFVVVWLLDSGREHLCSCFAQDASSFSFWGVGLGCPVFVVFVCVATSYEGRMVDALASRADEGRRSLR